MASNIGRKRKTKLPPEYENIFLNEPRTITHLSIGIRAQNKMTPEQQILSNAFYDNICKETFYPFRNSGAPRINIRRARWWLWQELNWIENDE